MAAVRASGVVKRFETTCALDAVDLVVEEGEVRGLLGPNGAGKTTLLRILFGLVRQDAGSVELFDQPAHEAGASPLTGVAGFVEDPSFYPYLSGSVNLELMAELDGGPTTFSVAQALERVGLRHRGSDRVSGYSTGMKQRLGIAAALLRVPRLLLLDEPTAGLDPAGVREIGSLVRELSADGAAILLSSHQIDEVEDVCDSFTVLRRGSVVWEGTAAELRAQAPASAHGMDTTDDARALELAENHAGIRAVAARDRGLAVSAETGALEAYVLALGRAGVAITRLQQLVSPLESMFFALTTETEIDITEPIELAERVLAADT